jgi:hypothetical protein
MFNGLFDATKFFPEFVSLLPKVFNNFVTAIPQLEQKKCWVVAVTLPEGRDEKDNNQPNTIEV